MKNGNNTSTFQSNHLLLLPQNIRFADELAVIRSKSQNDQHKITLLCLVRRKYEATHAEENKKTSMQ